MTVYGATKQYGVESVSITEFHRLHRSMNDKHVALLHRSMSFDRIRFQADIEQTTSDALNGVIGGQNTNTFAVFHIRTALDGNDIAGANA